ncbi:hypothetical protein HFO49_32380 [Rhizobium leguminosarum]|uniref:hypothetical protein n=1 Tax=Rhizobium leguminosarum TaxID=384 RepID=UPI001C939CB8|nr:hypothetical protein [Rhizobium leguminosarum]MBY3173013.1 hypothetical protein [Rhizobium laguerreae]MBY5592069.1 hypothetical protein [Rhizobium leguminosarum]MBY5605988.1 hypothetical protein [Rhizobium leguminosarum]MBY5727496.1 hypothetical protein [Rhizobium leguminosarum]
MPLPNALRGLILIPREDTLPTCHSSPTSHNGYNIADYRSGIMPGKKRVLAVKGHPPFILPMSAMKSKFIIAGIRISAKRCLFGASKNERQVGF